MLNIVQQQTMPTNLVIAGMAVKKIFVDGGFERIRSYEFTRKAFWG
jgi:hypothetical protein